MREYVFAGLRLEGEPRKWGLYSPSECSDRFPRGILRESKYSQYRSRSSKPTVQRPRKPVGGWFFWGHALLDTQGCIGIGGDSGVDRGDAGAGSLAELVRRP